MFCDECGEELIPPRSESERYPWVVVGTAIYCRPCARKDNPHSYCE